MELNLAIAIVVGIVAAFHLYVMWLEMFAWTTRGPKVFSQFPKELFPQTKTLAANQGLYNGFLAVGLIWSFFINHPEWKHYVELFFLSCVAVAGIYGGLTASKKIFFVQGIPALVGISLIVFSIQIVEKREKRTPEIKAWYITSDGQSRRDTFELNVGNKIGTNVEVFSVQGFEHENLTHTLRFLKGTNLAPDAGSFKITLDDVGIIYSEALTWRNSVVLNTDNDSLNEIILAGLSNALVKTELKILQSDLDSKNWWKYEKLLGNLITEINGEKPVKTLSF